MVQRTFVTLIITTFVSALVQHYFILSESAVILKKRYYHCVVIKHNSNFKSNRIVTFLSDKVILFCCFVLKILQ